MSRGLVLSWVKQSSVRSHFSSAQQLEFVRVMETRSGGAGESVSQAEPAEAPQIRHHVEW